jgi:hypothetical protein
LFSIRSSTVKLANVRLLTKMESVLLTLNFFVAREDLFVLYGELDCRALGSDFVASVAKQDLTQRPLRGSVASVLESLRRRGH